MLDEIWDTIVDVFWYIISFEWVGDIFEFLGSVWESVTSLENSPLTNVWFWAFYITYMVAMWKLPSAFGLPDYTLRDKILGSIIFFIIDWFVVVKFSE